MLISTIVDLLTGSPENPQGILGFISFIGEAGTAMLISVLFAIYSMGLKRGYKVTEVMDTLTNAIYPIGMMLLIIGGGGAFKQILIDGGVGKTVESLFTDTAMSPILLAWIVAAVPKISIRFCYSCCDINSWYCYAIIRIIRC